MRAFSYAWSLPVTWQRWRSHHSIRHSRKPQAACKLHGSMFCRTEVIANRRNRDFRPFLFLWPWPRSDDLHTNLTHIPSRYFGCAKMNFLRQGFRKLLYYRHRPTDRERDIHTDRQTDANKIIYHAASRVVINRSLDGLRFVSVCT